MTNNHLIITLYLNVRDNPYKPTLQNEVTQTELGLILVK